MRVLYFIKRNYSKPSIQYTIGIFIIVFFTTCYILLLLNRYWQFEFFSVDNVYFDTALWKVSRFQAPIVHQTFLGDINILGDHFHPTIFIFSLLYLLFPGHEIIFVGMSIAYGVGGFLGLLIGFKLIKSRFTTYTLLLAYFLYLGTQNAMIYGFHELHLVPIFFMLVMYSITYSKRKLYWISVAFLLLTKESMAIVLFTIGLFLLISPDKKRRIGLITMGLALIYYFIITTLVIPHFGGKFLYQEVILPKNLIDLVIALTYPPEKIKTFFVSVSTFGFLPLLNLATLPLFFQDFLLRYLLTRPGSVQYTLFFHYNIGLAPILLFSSIWSLYSLQKRKMISKYIPLLAFVIIGFTLYYHRFSATKGPLLLVFNPDFYALTEKNKFLWEIVKKTPTDGKVMTMNHLEYVFAHQDVYPMTKNIDEIYSVNPKYIVYDLREGQNPNNFFPITKDEMEKVTAELIANQRYEVFFHKGSMNILKKRL